jgi:hypothetical protein
MEASRTVGQSSKSVPCSREVFSSDYFCHYLFLSLLQGELLGWLEEQREGTAMPQMNAKGNVSA